MPADASGSFLGDLSLRQVALPAGCPFRLVGLAVGNGPSAVEVLVTDSATEPRLPNVRACWKERSGRRAAPLVLVVLHGGNATLCGPAGDDPPVFPNVDPGQAERICREALAQPDRHAALRTLRDAFQSVETRLPGVRNEGFLATHELEVGTRRLDEWPDADAKARRIIDQRGEALLAGLGFRVERQDQATSILRTAGDGKRVAVAVLLQQNEAPELDSPRFADLSPVSYAIAVADRENLPYVLVQQGAKLRLYPVKVGVGVGRRGRTETFVEIHTGLLRDADAAYLWLLFSADALRDGGTLARLLDESKRFAGSLAENLRQRIYEFVIPALSEGLAAARGLKKPKSQDLAATYEMAMTVLFRLLFIAYGEDKDLLPFRSNETYRARSLKQKAHELLALHHTGTPFDESDSQWRECLLLFESVEKGNTEWGIPPYDGGLFSADPAVSPVGALLAETTLPNTVMGPALHNLLLIGTPEGLGPVDFRSLGVREFGTIYEGLLESELAVAETDLTTDEKGFYRPCREGEEPVVRRRHIYLHNRSGARKASGTYFTKGFAVEHLLDQALEPALAEHLARLDAMKDDDDAAEALFDFRVADIAMGSGHFLVAAIDRIEKAFAQYLARRPLSGVRQEIALLRAAAAKALPEQVAIEDTQLLRRLIARRCIYGVDLNPVAVQLARVSIWIHTFVPGLPLSLLDHNLIAGNSLVGIGRVGEIVEWANQGMTDRERATPRGRARQQGWWKLDEETLLGAALEPLGRLARIADATIADVQKARRAYDQAREAVKPGEALCDLATAGRIDGRPLEVDIDHWDAVKDRLFDSREHRQARRSLEALAPLHFPVAFPEVFLRKRSGFDCVLGNPPWEEATVEEHAFWARHEPGLRGLTQQQQERLKASLREQRPDLVALCEKSVAEAASMRAALVRGPYPGMGTGDPDLYKAFCWRFWQLAADDGGRIGVVLPRSAWNAKGSTAFRRAVFATATLDLLMLLNTKGWVFDEAEPRYTISLVGIARGSSAPVVRLRGPFASEERMQAGIGHSPAEFQAGDVQSWTDTVSLPLLPAEESLEVFARLRAHPRLDLDDGKSWRARPHTELHATNDKPLMDLRSESRPRGFWPVFKGESFDLWQPDTGRYYAWADPKVVLPHLQKKRERGGSNARSAFSEFPAAALENPKTLPCQHPRIAFRDVTNRTNQRTVVVALLPPKVFVTNKGPYFLWPRGDERDMAYLLGVLSSLPLDWYARRFVETAMNFFILNPFPIPRPDREDPLRQRIEEIAGRLAAVDERYLGWAEALGVECGSLFADEKLDLICELDAVVARLYGLKRKHLAHIFATFHEAWGPGRVANHPTLGAYDSRLAKTIEHFERWGKK